MVPSFAYSLLASGVFLHDWRDSLRSQVGMIYPLTPEGQRAITIDENLRRLFDLHQATFSRNPLVNIDLSDFRALPKGFPENIPSIASSGDGVRSLFGMSWRNLLKGMKVSRHYVTSMPAPVASGWSGRVGLAPTGKRRLFTAHTRSGP
jgi:hypothetical protein